MKTENILGRKEDVKAILKALGIKEGDKPGQPKQLFSPREIIEASADGGINKTQNDWINYFNSRNKVMMSMPDLYYAGKSKGKKLLKALQEDFRKPRVMTSSRIIYQRDSLDANVVHYFGSTVVEPIEQGITIPDYSNKRLIDVIGTSEGLAFFQAIFGTEDDKKDIFKTLATLSGQAIEKIKVLTFGQMIANAAPDRVLVCVDCDDYFRIGCYDVLDFGRSSVVGK